MSVKALTPVSPAPPRTPLGVSHRSCSGRGRTVKAKEKP